MSANQLTLWYLVASVCFILALKGLSSPTTARRGNLFGMAGMTIAVLTTIAVVGARTHRPDPDRDAGRRHRWRDHRAAGANDADARTGRGDALAWSAWPRC